MEFVNKSEVGDLLREHGYEEFTDSDGRAYLSMPDQDGVVHLHFVSGECDCEPRANAEVIKSTPDELPRIIDQIIHRLNLRELMLIPVVKWRNVFDAVAFSMAANEAWQEFDATATVELNTRDPLLCGPEDFHLVTELIAALFSDAEGPDPGFMLTAISAPVLAEVVPDGAVRLSIGNRVLADEIMDVVSA